MGRCSLHVKVVILINNVDQLAKPKKYYGQLIAVLVSKIITTVYTSVMNHFYV